MTKRVQKTITGEDQWTDPLEVSKDSFDVSVSGTFVADVKVQRRRKDDTGWRDVRTYSDPREDVSRRINSLWQFRIGVDTGDFTSGSPIVELTT